jgi:hypothetical protein
VLEVERPERQRRSSRRNVEKSDPSDAERAARAVLAGDNAGVPNSGDGRVEMIRTLRAARRSAIKARTQAANQLQGLRVTAPEELRRRLCGLSTKELVSVAARFSCAQILEAADTIGVTKFLRRILDTDFGVFSTGHFGEWRLTLALPLRATMRRELCLLDELSDHISGFVRYFEHREAAHLL